MLKGIEKNLSKNYYKKIEMKNENDATKTKKKNEDFLKELDKDRKAKGCEYAVLVSLLETDNELYNNGIVDMSHRYEKMYVVRPQFFGPFLLDLAERNARQRRHHIGVARAAQVRDGQARGREDVQR